MRSPGTDLRSKAGGTGFAASLSPSPCRQAPNALQNLRISGQQRSKSCRDTGYRRSVVTVAAAMPVTTEDVRFESESGKKLAGILTAARSEEAVILCHGLASHKNGFHLKAIAEALAPRGFGSLRFDFSGNGDSEGSFRYANHSEEAGDIAAAARFLEQRGKRVIGLLGHSKAGSSVLLYSAKFGGIPRVVNCSGRFNHKRGLEERFGADVYERMQREGAIPVEWMTSACGKIKWVFEKQDLEERLAMDMASICQNIPESVDVLTIHGSSDATIPVEDAKKFSEQLRGHRLTVVDGADHNYSREEHKERLILAVVEFLSAASV